MKGWYHRIHWGVGKLKLWEGRYIHVMQKGKVQIWGLQNEGCLLRFIIWSLVANCGAFVLAVNECYWDAIDYCRCLYEIPIRAQHRSSVPVANWLLIYCFAKNCMENSELFHVVNTQLTSYCLVMEMLLFVALNVQGEVPYSSILG